MSFSLAIVGLPNAGKSTLFNALLSRRIANVAPYPFCTIDPNVGVVAVPDERLVRLAQLVQLEEKMDHLPPTVPAIVEFKDIAGLVTGASKGEGLGNKFLSHIRESAAIVHVLRAFTDTNVVREEEVNPRSDFEIIKTELCLADLQTLEKQREPSSSVATKEDKLRWETVLKLRKWLGEGLEVTRLRPSDSEGFGGQGSEMWNEEEWKVIESLFLLTAKPAIFVLNVDEKEAAGNPGEIKKKWNLEEMEDIIPICAQVEMELSDLNPEERIDYLKELDLQESGLEKLIKKGYKVLGLITFYTVKGGKETRAWSLQQGKTALDAAAEVHTDMARGFIKAEVVTFSDLVSSGSWVQAASKGKIRLEGKDYVMREGDVVEFKFNL